MHILFCEPTVYFSAKHRPYKGTAPRELIRTILKLRGSRAGTIDGHYHYAPQSIAHIACASSCTLALAATAAIRANWEANDASRAKRRLSKASAKVYSFAL